MRIRLTLLTLLTLLFACSQESADDATWQALDDEDLVDDNGKDSDAKADDAPCGDEVVEGDTCDGDWTTTTCVDETGAWWWCEDGAWTTDK